ncbi:hypothetical protein MKW98_018909 [Papaver atlanticum]|uniref:Uncharacterized protein n=1 Tax=Papaver atlanticum TaxID=357466 RepID=A0AAD4TJ46_9MAGN|nr:hypothetical protein MKW98_018909 [Papaver atlanticum]
MLLALIFLGTWPANFAFSERKGRLPQHTYLDYSVRADNWPCVLFAMEGGPLLSVGNLVNQYAWALVGLSVTEVVCSSVKVVIGTTLNYFLDDRINKAEILFPGVACFLVAVFLGSALHSSNLPDNKAKLSSYSNEKESRDAPDSIGTANFLIELKNNRAIKVFGKNTLIILGVTFSSGLCFSLFSPAFNLATNDQWGTMKEGVPHLVVYTAFFHISVSCFMVVIILNVIFLYYPAYLNDWDGRKWALFAELLCGFGNRLQFMGGQAAGYAASDVVQHTLGILVFGEYRKSSRRTYVLLVSMLLMFIVAVGILMASSGHRKTA